jgi:hypothetical protein
MALIRENILSLIGSRRYHSAVLTTFSFDFFFFEMKAMKWLRSCGIRNVNVLMDGHYYSELMQQLGGEEMKLSPGYSLYPIFGKSIFHPKVWMLLGEKEGLLIIGSGNLTNAGNGNNEEIWGAFHFDVRIAENAALFSTSWSYIQQLCSKTKGYTQEKTTRWIVDHAKWLNELPKPAPSEFHTTAGKEKVAFLYNDTQTTIWQQLTDLIGNQKVVEVTSLSPYYDNNGKAIQELSKLYPTAKVNIVLDDTGSVPEKMPVANNCTFYNWYDLGISRSMHSKSEVNAGKSKLHAKILHFKTASGKEYCLFGSANVTPEGLGLPGVTPNGEVSLLIESPEGGLLSRLGIKLKKPSTLSDFKVTKENSIYDSVIGHNRYKVCLLSAEWVYDDLYLYADGNYESELLVKLFDSENRLLQSLDIGVFSHEMKVKPHDSLQGVLHVELYDKLTEKPVSNKALLADHYLLAKTHPNPKTEDIERIYNDIQGGELNKVLDLLQYAILDETEWAESATGLANKGTQAVKTTEKNGPEKMYDLSGYKAIELHSIEKGLMFSSLSLRVLDVLKFVRSKNFIASTQSELRVDEQEEDLGNTSGVDETELTIVKNISLAALKSEKRKLISYLDNLYDHQQFLIYSNQKPKDYKPTLTDLTKYLIALELLFEFGGRTEKYVEKEKEHQFVYLPTNGEEPYYNDNVKGCCLNIVGDFLMLVRYGFKKYEFDYTRNKISQLLHEAFISTILFVLNMRWKESEEKYVKCLLLNCLHYLGYRNTSTFENEYPFLKKNVFDKAQLLKYKTPLFQDNLNWLEKKILPAFNNTISNLERKDFDSTAVKGSIIYKSPWGYCWTKDISKYNEFTLIRPGFLWDDHLGDFVMHSNDEIYRPIPLKQFILVNV